MHQDSPESDSSPTTQSSYRDSLLKSNSENFKLFIEECGDPFFVHDIHGNILEVNRTACESLGYTRSELLSLNVKDIETGFSLEALDRLWSSLISGEIFDLDGEHTRKDGTKFPVEVRFSKMPGQDEPMLVAVVRDCSERKEREAQLKLLNENLTRALEVEKELTERLTMRVTLTNILAESKSMEEAAPRLISAIVEGEWDAGYMCAIDHIGRIIHGTRAATSTSDRLEKLEESLKAVVLKKDHWFFGKVWTACEPKWTEDLNAESTAQDMNSLRDFGFKTMVVCPIVGSDLVLGAFCVFSHDERKMSDDTLNLLVSIGRQVGQFQDEKRAQNIAKEVVLMRQRDDFMALLTHDLKTPLLGANRILELLTRELVGNLNDEQRRILKQLQNSNAELVSMVQNLIQVYKFERELAHAKFIETDVTVLLETTVSSIIESAKSKGIELVCTVPEEHIVAAIDAESISRLIQNLIDNAIKFTPEKGIVTVHLENTKVDEWLLSVSDTGVGLSEEECSSLFTRFWQGIMGKKYSASVGLGLYLCKQIVDAHDGTIECKSKKNEGSLFTVKLPRQQVRIY
jgi:two-component system, sensor histidine kinase and response regulator